MVQKTHKYFLPWGAICLALGNEWQTESFTLCWQQTDCMGSHKGFGCSSFLPFPHKMPLIGMLQPASLLGLVGFGGLLQSSGSAWPQVANHWVQVVWLQQNCKVRSGWPLARYQAIHKFVTHSDGHHTWGWCSNPFFLGWWICFLLVKQIIVSITWIFTMDFLDLFVSGFNELPQWLQL